MDISVVLCTYNRSEDLAKALTSAMALALPETVEWELLVVDNNSKDKTREVAEEFRRRPGSRIRYVFEPHQGKSHALNAGIREARGAIVAFMDDDVKVDPHWLQNVLVSMQDAGCAGMGGRVFAEWNRPAPRWLAPNAWYASGPLVQFDRGDAPCDLHEAPIGTNMAFRKSMFEKYGDFQVELGPRPGSEIRGEDSEFGDRLLKAGERLRYEPSAIVYHPVPENRLKKEFFQAWWFHKGESGIRQFGVRPGTKYYAAGIPLYMFRNLLVWTARWMLAIRPVERYANKLSVWSKLGEMTECRRLSIQARKGTQNCRA
jgi:glycosyltransferase involved in cell wall biosynthesis